MSATSSSPLPTRISSTPDPAQTTFVTITSTADSAPVSTIAQFTTPFLSGVPRDPVSSDAADTFKDWAQQREDSINVIVGYALAGTAMLIIVGLIGIFLYRKHMYERRRSKSDGIVAEQSITDGSESVSPTFRMQTLRIVIRRGHTRATPIVSNGNEGSAGTGRNLGNVKEEDSEDDEEKIALAPKVPEQTAFN